MKMIGAVSAATRITISAARHLRRQLRAGNESARGLKKSWLRRWGMRGSWGDSRLYSIYIVIGKKLRN
jgi:hypothetical protein